MPSGADCLKISRRSEMLRFRTIIIQVLMPACMWLACEETQEETPVSHFERPQDVALVCFNPESRKTVPLDCCKNDLNLDDEACEYGGDTTKLYAFVTETILGEVVVVDMEGQHLVGAYSSEESSAFIPVGERPNDIAATDDGQRIYTANRESGDLSVIHTELEGGGSVMETPYLAPAGTIDLGDSAARMALVKQPEKYKDRIALVTQPELGRLAVVALDKEMCPKGKRYRDGCVKGYLPLSPEESEEMIQPYALTDASGDMVYVGCLDSTAVFAIRIEPLLDAAMEMDDATEVPAEGILIETIDLGYRVRQLSIEPEKRRWLYGIGHDRREVIAANIGERAVGDPVNVQKVSVGGVPNAVRVLELAEDDDPGPMTFNGTFAVVSSSGDISVIDIEDQDFPSEYFRPNRIRSAVDFSSGKGPRIASKPILTLNDRVDDALAGYVGFVEEDGGPGCDAGDPYRAGYDQGIRLRCDPYQNRSGEWVLEWQGPIRMDGLGVITNINDKGDGPWRLLNNNMREDFCAFEVMAKDAFPGYPGDRLRILSPPSPLEDAEERCEEIYGKHPPKDFYLRIVGISKYFEEDEVANVLEVEKIDEDSKDLLPECYGQVFEFEIFASEHWTVQAGSVQPRKGIFVADEKVCLYDENTPSDIRVFIGQTYRNNQMIFKLEHGEPWRDDPTVVNGKDVETATYKFRISGGYRGLDQAIGVTNVTDIEIMPDNELLLLDQNGEGLVVFDLLGEFSSVGRHIY